MANDRLKIEYDLTFATPFHCGTGIRAGLIDRTVVRDDGGYLYVPGSTIKGVLRERCEQLARLYDQQNIASPHDAKAALQGLGQQRPSLVTRIFGSQNMPGRLFFEDARQDEKDVVQYDSPERRGGKGKYRSLQVNVATQVRLDRPTRTAVPGALYTSEFGVSDILFKGTILGWLDCTPIASTSDHAEPGQPAGVTPTYSLLLLLAGLRMIEWLGGNKSTGKGHCTCMVTSLAVDGVAVEANTWQSWFEQLDELANYGREG
ncbi:MAG: RAMP superfamily CRISPR-associated protein [Chloroflexota bacterium]|nr:RAMP superfamily CRISPR-associated protein [Chloroflexota bacterium]